MSCNDLNPIHEPAFKEETPIKIAGEAVGIDLTKPVDLSGMAVMNVSIEPYREQNGDMKHIRTAELAAYVFNSKGEREWLEITIKLKSNRRPDL